MNKQCNSYLGAQANDADVRRKDALRGATVYERTDSTAEDGARGD